MSISRILDNWTYHFVCSLASAHGSKKNSNFTLKSSVSLTSGMNDVSLLSVMVGLPVLFNHFTVFSTITFTTPAPSLSLTPTFFEYICGAKDSGAFLESKIAGVRGVRIQTNQQIEDFTNYTWGYQVIHSLIVSLTRSPNEMNNFHIRI